MATGIIDLTMTVADLMTGFNVVVLQVNIYYEVQDESNSTEYVSGN